MKLSSPAKKMIFFIGILCLVMIIGGVVFYRSVAAISFAVGVIMTSALNVLKVAMIQRTVNKLVEIEDDNAGRNFARLQALLRLFTSGAVLVLAAVLAAFVPFVDISLLWGAIIGIFTLKIAAILAKFVKPEEDEQAQSL